MSRFSHPIFNPLGERDIRGGDTSQPIIASASSASDLIQTGVAIVSLPLQE